MDDLEVPMTTLSIRMAAPADAPALERLAQLDSHPALREPVLVAEVGGELWSAISLDDGAIVADPFRPTGELQFLLVERARQVHRGARRRPGRIARALEAVTGHGPTTRPAH
jgi:hypothetical protein